MFLLRLFAWCDVGLVALFPVFVSVLSDVVQALGLFLLAYELYGFWLPF